MPETAPNDRRHVPTLALFQACAPAACGRYQRAVYIPVWHYGSESLGTTRQRAAVTRAAPRACLTRVDGALSALVSEPHPPVDLEAPRWAPRSANRLVIM